MQWLRLCLSVLLETELEMDQSQLFLGTGGGTQSVGKCSGTGNQASVNVVSRFINSWCDLEDTISGIETLPECAGLFCDCRFQSHKNSLV